MKRVLYHQATTAGCQEHSLSFMKWTSGIWPWPFLVVVFSPVFDSLHFDVAAENRIHNFVEHVRVFNLRLDQDFLALGSLGLNIVLPEVALLLGALAALVGAGALEITVI